MQSSRQAQYQHSMVPHYGSPHLHPSPHNSDHNSPEEGSIANHGQGPYRYIMPRDGNLATYPNLGQGSSSSQVTWSNKAEDDNGYATYPPTH